MQQDPKLVNTLELSVRFGKTLLVTEVDGVLPLLVPAAAQATWCARDRATSWP